VHHAFGEYAHSGKEGIGEDTNTIFQKTEKVIGK
jgi:hypothetical protein